MAANAAACDGAPVTGTRGITPVAGPGDPATRWSPLSRRRRSKGREVSPPALSHYVLMVGGLLAALALMCAGLSLLDRLMWLRTARVE